MLFRDAPLYPPLGNPKKVPSLIQCMIYNTPGFGTHDNIKAFELCLKCLHLANTHDPWPNTDRWVTTPTFEARERRSGKHLKGTRCQRKSYRTAGREDGFQGGWGGWISINQEGKRKEVLPGWGSCKHMSRQCVTPCLDHQGTGRRKRRRNAEEDRESKTEHLSGISWEQRPLAISSVPMAVTARSPTSMERKMRLLTVLWVPAHGVQVEVAVVEEELVIRTMASPLKQGHQVTPIDDPGG